MNGIPRSILWDRLSGVTNLKITRQNRKRLSPKQENFIPDGIIHEDEKGPPPTHSRELGKNIWSMDATRIGLGICTSTRIIS